MPVVLYFVSALLLLFPHSHRPWPPLPARDQSVIWARSIRAGPAVRRGGRWPRYLRRYALGSGAPVLRWLLLARRDAHAGERQRWPCALPRWDIAARQPDRNAPDVAVPGQSVRAGWWLPAQ